MIWKIFSKFEKIPMIIFEQKDFSRYPFHVDVIERIFSTELIKINGTIN